MIFQAIILFLIFITLLGLIAAYLFYALWHSKELNTTKEPIEIKEKTVEDLTNKELIPRKALPVPENYLPVSPSIKIENKEIEGAMKKHQQLIFESPKNLEEKTQVVYQSLVPEEHEETMTEANHAFDSLDEQVSSFQVEELIENEIIDSLDEELIAE